MAGLFLQNTYSVYYSVHIGSESKIQTYGSANRLISFVREWEILIGSKTLNASDVIRWPSVSPSSDPQQAATRSLHDL